MYIYAEIPVSTSLDDSHCSITNYDEYQDYINDQIFSNDTPTLRATYNSKEFGNVPLKFMVKKNYLFGYQDKAFIYAYGAVQNYEDPIKVICKLEEDSKFFGFLEDNAQKFMTEFNSSIDFVHPTYINFEFSNGKLLTELSPYESIKNPEWVKFALVNVYNDIGIYEADIKSFYEL